MTFPDYWPAREESEPDYYEVLDERSSLEWWTIPQGKDPFVFPIELVLDNERKRYGK